MFARSFLVWVFVAASTASVVSAQDMTNKELTAEVLKLNSRITQIMESLKLQGDAIASQSLVQKKHDDHIKGLEADLKEQQALQGQLAADLKRLNDDFQEQLTKQRQILEVISRTDSTGQRIPRLSAIMEKSEDFRQEMSEVVNKSIRPEGRLILTNRTTLPQTVYVNRHAVTVNTGETKVVPVRVGTVTTQVPGREIVNWSVGAPQYEQYVDIVPGPEALTYSYAPY